MANPNMVKGGPSVNPGGRPRKTEAMREAEEALAALSPAAVAKLGELMATASQKIQATVALGIVRATVGELSRVAGPGGEPQSSGVKVEDLAEFGLWRLEKRQRELLATQLHLSESSKT